MAGGELTGMFAWMFLPKLASSLVLTAAHWVLQRTSPRLVPHQSTKTYERHQRLSYIFVILIYLVYTLWETERNMAANYYHILGLTPKSFTQSELRRNFRHLSLALHPDKNPQGERQFIAVQAAYKVLADPVSRFVYDHAGLEAAACQSCTTVSDYILASIPRRTGVYMMYILGNVALQVFRLGLFGTYWRYIAICSFMALEILMMTGTSDPGFIRFLSWAAPHRTSFEIAQILRQLMVCIFIALNQIGPQFIPRDQGGNTKTLAGTLSSFVEKTNEEIVSGSRRMANMFVNTGLRRQLEEALAHEMRLGVAMGTDKSFGKEMMGRMQAEHAKNRN
ncbi:hypothetical protein LPJ64_003487 [Coemansia asiatica]|uniref:J domain-containing protein n=1 Tax=Coemansia asiatica TaxID=1052880 RepID=A0A9W7XLL5_9FUNG|nr:hypothetical protein LPJ64_003487 [Coemansia asiatica]